MKKTIIKSGDYTYTLKKEAEELEVIGRFKLKGNEQLKVNLTVIHQAKNTKGVISIKATLDDQAKASITGTIIVEEKANGTESFLEERVLLLSTKATAEAIPNLEIKTNDVRCSHAATVGQIDEEQLFYLVSRGVPSDEAKSLLAEAFLK